MKRIGEILVEHGWVTGAVLARALAKQQEIPRRLCSLLIAGGVLQIDQASRALGEQLGVPAVLQKHLDHRDQALAALIPAELARSWCVIPIGRLGTGELIVCARDPQPNVLAALSAVLDENIVLAVAPATQIETLVAETYGTGEQDWDVDLNTGPIASLDLDPHGDEADPMAGLVNLTLVGLDDQGVTRDPTQSGMVQIGAQQHTSPLSSPGMRIPPTLPPSTRSAPAITLPPSTRSAPAITPPSAAPPPTAPPPSAAPQPTAPPRAAPQPTAPPRAAPRPAAEPVDRPQRPSTPQPTRLEPARPEAARPSPVAAQQARVDPDVIAAAYATPPPTYDPAAIAVGTVRPTRRFLSFPTSLSDTFAALSSASTQDDATAAAMKFASGRWRTALLLSVKEKTALGEAGRGSLLSEDVVAGLAIPLAVPSIVSLALEARAVTTALPADGSPVQDRLDRLLGMPRFPAAIPILVDGRAAFVLVIGDAIADDMGVATADLDLLADALGTAYSRLAHAV